MVTSYSDFRALDPSKYLDNVSPGRTATIVVAASNSSLQSKAQADFVCDGVDDHVEIQAALDTCRDIKLSEGQFNCEVTINILNSNQTLRGCGRNTILTTTTADLIFLSAVGGAGTEKTGIIITDLQIDGGAGAVSDCGIYFEYVDYSLIQNVYSRRHASGTGSYLSGIYLLNSDFNQIVNNICQGNGDYGIFLYYSNNNTVSGNTCQGNGYGIYLVGSKNNIITANTCQGNDYDGIDFVACSGNTSSYNTIQGNGAEGIYLGQSPDNTVSGNTCRGNGRNGIELTGNSNNNAIIGNTCRGNGWVGIVIDPGDNNTVSGNTCIRNSQVADDAYDNIGLVSSSYNLILGNLCRAPTVGTTLTVGELAGATDIHVTDTADFEVGDGVVIDLGGANVEYHRISAITAGAPGIITIPAPGLINAQGAGETIDMPEARYGINISDDVCARNCLVGNDLYDSGKTGDLNDAAVTNPTLKHDNRNLAGTGWLAEV